MSQGHVCVPNIGPRGRRRRLLAGVFGLLMGASLGGLVVLTGTSVFWRATVFVPFWFGALGLLQAHEKT